MTATTELIAEAIGHAIEHHVVDDVSRREIAAVAASAALTAVAAVQQPNRDALFEAIAERLGEHEKAYNEFDPSDEAVTCITLRGMPVERLAEFIAPAVLAALPIPATGEVEWEYQVVNDEEGYQGGPITLEEAVREANMDGDRIERRTKAVQPGTWVEVTT